MHIFETRAGKHQAVHWENLFIFYIWCQRGPMPWNGHSAHPHQYHLTPRVWNCKFKKKQMLFLAPSRASFFKHSWNTFFKLYFQNLVSFFCIAFKFFPRQNTFSELNPLQIISLRSLVNSFAMIMAFWKAFVVYNEGSFLGMF